jgi:ActD protein
MQGVLGSFHEIDAAVHAIEDLNRGKFGELTVFMPTPRHEFEEVLARPKSAVRKYTLAFGLMGVTFGYWIAIWISDYWPIVVGGKPVASWVPYTIIGFEVMVLVGGLATVFAMFGLARIPRLTMTVGYDERFSHGDFGIWVATTPEQADDVARVLTKHGATEVRRER